MTTDLIITLAAIAVATVSAGKFGYDLGKSRGIVKGKAARVKRDSRGRFVKEEVK